MPDKAKTLHIFRAGTHTCLDGRTLSFSEADLAATAQAYDPARHEAPIVVGHPTDDSPAYGWIGSLAASGDRLSARPAQVNPAFAEAVADGQFKKVSACFYHPDSKANPVPGVWYLRHVGFLGGMPPAVKGLDSPSFAGGAEDYVSVEFGEELPYGTLSRIAGFFRGLRDYIINRDGLETADSVLPAWGLDWLAEDAVKAQTAPAADPEYAEKHNPQKERKMDDSTKVTPTVPPTVPTVPTAPAAAGAEGLAARMSALEAREAAFAERVRLRDAQDAVKAVVAAGRLTPAQAGGLAEFMAGLDELDGVEVAFGEGDNQKTLSRAAYFQEFLNRLPVQVEFAEKSAPNPDESIDGATPEEVARRAVMYRERLAKDGMTITVTEAVAAVKAGTDKKEAANG